MPFQTCLRPYREGKGSSGNASRAGFLMGRGTEPIPTTQPHNLKVGPGDASQEEIIRDTKRGVLVGRLWYTYAINPTKGDFSCTARSGIRVIENGEVRHPGKPARIVHSLPSMLMEISAVGNDHKNTIQWASLPSIAPSIRAENVFINPI